MYVKDLNDVTNEMGHRIDDDCDEELNGYRSYSSKMGNEGRLERGGFDFKNKERNEKRMGRRNSNILIRHVYMSMERNRM
jgi:hypothetical protein